ncbi:hypothetical protein EV360DRAFT_71628 [Lentinula raphanica]|nr:hypothetical protein EV360DRAFT_71628 [Lentinula raphanica]
MPLPRTYIHSTTTATGILASTAAVAWSFSLLDLIQFFVQIILSLPVQHGSRDTLSASVLIPTSSAGSLFVSTSHKNSHKTQHSARLPTTSRLEERNQVVRRYSGQYSSLTARLLRTNKQGKIIKPGTKVTKDEEWTLFIGPDGFNASPGPGGTLIAQTARREIRSGFSLATSKSTQDLGEKAGFGSAVERDKVFNELLTQVPALHAGNGVPKTNLAYLNGIFAYLYSVKAVHNPEPPEAWVKLYNEMHALGGSAD